MERYYQPEIECASREQILAWQNERLVKQVRNVWDNVPYYRKKMEEKGVRPEDIKSLDDIRLLPFLTKDDLREAYPYGLLATPLERCVRIQSTSGTTGKRVVAFYTQGDIDIWEECCARAIVAAGGDNRDVVQVSYGYGLFTGGPGLNGGSHKVGCLTIPTSSGNTDRQIQFMIDLQATFLCCTPSYAMYLAEECAGRLRVNCADPGVVNSGMITMHRWFDPLANLLFRPFTSSPGRGAESAMQACLSPHTGMIFHHANCHPIANELRPEAAHTRLVAQTDEWLRQYQVIHK